MRWRQYIINRIVVDELSIAQRNLLDQLSQVEVEDEDGHDAIVADRIVTMFADVCAELFPRTMRIASDYRVRWVDTLRRLLAAGLEGGRYTDLLPLVWTPEELFFQHSEKEASKGFAHVVCLGRLLANRATCCLNTEDAYGMQASRVLLLALHKFCASTAYEELSIKCCNEDEIASQISRLSLYAQEGYDGMCERGIGNWNFFRFPPGIKPFELQTICGDAIKGEHVVPPTDFHFDFSESTHWRLLKTTVHGLLTLGADPNYVWSDSSASDSDDSSDEPDPLWDHLCRRLNVKLSMGVSWELDLFKFVTDGSWYFVPVLAIRYWGMGLSDQERCHLRSDAFIERAARWYMMLHEGIGVYHRYSCGETRVDDERARNPPFEREYRENGEGRVDDWKYAVPVSFSDRF